MAGSILYVYFNIMITIKKVALVIGCSYKDSNNDIPILYDAIGNAQKMVDLLTKFGYVVIFMNDNCVKTSALYPIHKNIQNTFANLLQNTQSGDDVVIFYTGHGAKNLANQMNIVIDPNGKNDAIVPVDNNLIDDETLGYWLQQYGKKGVRIFLFFDCFHDGTMCGLQYSYSCSKKINTNTVNVKNNSFNQEFNQLQRATIITLSASKDSKDSKGKETIETDTQGRQSNHQGSLTSSFIYNIQTSVNGTKDIFKLLHYISIYLSNYKLITQCPKITSSIPLHDQTHDSNRYILDGMSHFKMV